MDLGNRWEQLCRTFAASSVGAGIERVYLRVPKFRWWQLGSKKGKHSTDLVAKRLRTAGF